MTIDYNDFQTIADKYKINKPYVLYVGVAYPHKNLEALVLAFSKINSHTKEELNLVLVGKEDYFYKRLKKLIRLVLKKDLL